MPFFYCVVVVIDMFGQLTSERVALLISSFLEGEHFIFTFKALFSELKSFPPFQDFMC